MAEYLLIESRDPFEFANVASNYQQAVDLVRAGNKVTLFLVQNGVLPARLGTIADGLKDAAKNGVTILVDEFSLRERAIAPDAAAAPVAFFARYCGRDSPAAAAFSAAFAAAGWKLRSASMAAPAADWPPSRSHWPGTMAE